MPVCGDVSVEGGAVGLFSINYYLLTFLSFKNPLLRLTVQALFKCCWKTWTSELSCAFMHSELVLIQNLPIFKLSIK